ncbi:type II secretion system protein J [Sedimentisphaera cyanobacteriorum]|uniref:Type II secretion system protein J n=1 Tax=Sedimentisphaera cyanobacteriorum TaxID=1940790 RepID=A0A1Q2HP51_9BACT|nr:type II secretion system protein GspJ [Sedimentisphaera cyanobacteriorum]AQQ09130.1 type II secretion system protein J [Sedimentisphaera cyanobacteriorum]
MICAGSNTKTAFTLIELVMAMALINIIALSLYSSLRIAFDAKDSAEAALEPYRTIVPVFESIRRDITCVSSPEGILFGEFLGESNEEGDYPSDQLSFYSAGFSGSADSQTCNVAEITYALAYGEDEVPMPAQVNIEGKKENLLVRYVRYNPLSEDGQQLNEDILFAGVRSLEIEYYYQSQWLEEWSSSNRDNAVPEAVRFSIGLYDTEDDKQMHSQDQENQDESVYSKTFLLRCSEPAEGQSDVSKR